MWLMNIWAVSGQRAVKKSFIKQTKSKQKINISFMDTRGPKFEAHHVNLKKSLKKNYTRHSHYEKFPEDEIEGKSLFPKIFWSF